ncbi:MAG: DNA modification methylase, partial [Caldisericia bacterium]|nr:DNA modification methylase [Caldisericia bacterium]
QGLATADNGRFVGVLENTGMAKNIEKTRPAKLTEAILSNNLREFNFIKNKGDAIHFLNSKNEMEIREIFDNLKAKYGRDIFGKGYLYKIISRTEIADVDSLSEEERKSGIDSSKAYFVPYDKGDKEGNRWYLETPFCLDWSKESVRIYKTSPKCRWQGYDFYFKEGFCWTNVLNPNAMMIKCKLKSKTVNDVGSMSLYSYFKKTPEFYLVCLINSTFLFKYYRTFINSSVNIQINDLRQLTIIIPTKQQLSEFKELFDEAVKIKKMQFSNQITKKESILRLNQIQKQLDKMVYDLYMG